MADELYCWANLINISWDIICLGNKKGCQHFWESNFFFLVLCYTSGAITYCEILVLSNGN